MILKGWTKFRWTRSRLVLAGGLASLAVLLTADAWGEMVHSLSRGVSPLYVGALTVAAAVLIWVRRQRLLLCQPTSSLFGPLCVALGLGALLCGSAQSLVCLWYAGAILTLVGAVIWVMGKDVLFEFMPVLALGVLFFVIPVMWPPDTCVAATANGGAGPQLPGFVAAITLLPVGEFRPLATTPWPRLLLALALLAYTAMFSRPYRPRLRGLVIGAGLVTLGVGYAASTLAIDWTYLEHNLASTTWWGVVGLAVLAMIGLAKLLRQLAGSPANSTWPRKSRPAGYAWPSMVR